MAKYTFKKFQPLSLRLWHWLNVAVILSLLGTVLIRKTFLSWRANSVLIQEKLNEAGTTITADLAKEIAVAIRNPLWDWHIYLGFALAALFLGRLLIVLIIEKKCIGLQALKDAFEIKNLPVEEKSEAIHYTFVKIGYAVFYLATAIMVVTGLMLNFKNELGISKTNIGAVKEVHELLMWFFIVFIVGHLFGIIFAENKNDQGLVSDMINGGDPKKK
ncbi:MAG: cytochrome b/b6 domain-containing protein [Pseudobdellovibrio sp.]